MFTTSSRLVSLSLQGDFCNMEFSDDTFDGLYALDSTVHAKSPLDVYKEVFRVLKPGALFVDSAWVMTDKYDPNNPEHVKIKAKIEVSPFFPVCLSGTMMTTTKPCLSQSCQISSSQSIALMV